MRSSPLRSAIVASGFLACVSLVRCGSEPNALASFPAAAAMADGASPIRETSTGFVLETNATTRWRSPSSVRAELSRSAGEPMWISASGVPGRVAVFASGDEARVAVGDVVRAGDSRFLFARGGTIEDLALVREGRTREWRLVLPHGLSLRAIADASIAEIVDAEERPLLRIRADRAWDALGRELTPSLAGSNDTIRVTIPDGAHYPVLVDPTWTTSATPIFLRSGHSATLLGDGRVFFAGGGASPSSTEIYDPWSGRFVASGKMLAARTAHTATLLRNGKVLLAGGDAAASAELYDPQTGTFTATGSMSAAHGGGLRLASGKVLFTGGADANAEIYDPATGTFTKTAPRNTAGGAALVTLASGRILAVGDNGSDIFDPSKSTWTPVPSAPTGTYESATLTRFGNVLATQAQACVSASGDPRQCSMLLYDFDETANAGAGSFTQLSGGITSIEEGLNATLLTNGSVLLVPSSGPAGGPVTPTLYDPQAKTTSSDSGLTTPHRGATATLLPGGDVLVAGGDQTSTDVRIAPGAIGFSAMATARQGHGAVRIRDGRLLVVNSEAVGNPGPFLCQPPPNPCPPPIPDQTRSAEIFDPTTHAFTVTTGTPARARGLPLLVLLPSGKVLVAGGVTTGAPMPIATAEIFDPATQTFHDAGNMVKPRWGAQGALLPDGRAIVVGGFDGSNPTNTTEIFDPKTETFSAGPNLLESLSGHGLVKLPTGKILVVGSSTAEIFDPLTNAFRSAASPPTGVDGSTAQLLADGRVFVASASTLAGMLYDPPTDAWSFSANGAFAAAAVVWTPTVDGRVFSVGGEFNVGGESQQELYDPSSGRPVVVASTGIRLGAAGAMVASGETILAGGNSGAPEGISHPLSSVLIWSQGALASSRPTITSIPPQVSGGASIAIAGTGFASGAEGSTGNGRSSAANAPSAVWLSDATGTIVPGRITDFTDTTATWIAPATALTGHGWLFVYSNGVASAGAELTIAPAENAVHCRFDADCKTGFCTDGVCCDQRCDGVCQGCSAAHKTTGDDGVCGPVPPGNRDIAHRCFADNGQSCQTADECKSGFCIDGGNGSKLCCDAPCEGACLSCTQSGSVGACTAVSQGACDVACDGAHTLKKVGQPDVDCTPFTCSGKTCRTSCASARDCVAPFVCTDTGACVADVNPPPSDASLLGCSLSLAGRGSSCPLGVLAFALLALRRRRR